MKKRTSKYNRMTKLQKEQLKQWYIDGMPVTDICTALNISRDTFYYHKKTIEIKQGVDLESLRLANLRSQKNLAEKETEFLNSLIIAFEESMHLINEIQNPSERLDTLTKYVNTYYKLKAPKDKDCSQQVIDAITKTIFEISQIALEKENSETVQFLHKYSNTILERVLKNKR